MNSVWQLQVAKNRLSELVDAAVLNGAQIITRHGKPVVKVVPLSGAEVEVLVWSDLVKGSMGRGIAGTYAQLARTAWLYLSSGALIRLIRLRKGPMIAALYPAVALVAQALAAVLVAGLVLGLGAGLPWALGWLLALVAGWAVLEGFRRIDHRLFVYYLMHDYAFTTVAGGAYPVVLEARLAEFRAQVRAALESGVDEVLVVGHSSGVHLGVSVLADLIREGVPDGPALGFLSLGQAVPMVSYLPGAARLRGDLAYLSAREELTWVDVSAPGDGCSRFMSSKLKYSEPLLPLISIAI